MTITSPHGVVVVDKPVGPTSFSVVRDARRATGIRKIGHGGTLDPLASGVLPICLGEGTKLAQFLLDADKEYAATIQFGAETETDDAGGAVTRVQSASHLTAEHVERTIRGFLGEQPQVPPMYSALKREGRPLYELARAGETVDRAPRTIRILEFELLSFEPSVRDSQQDSSCGPRAKVRVRCSKGTYIRTLARDLGTRLETAAHLAALRRTRSGPFDLKQAIVTEDLGRLPLPVIGLAEALSHLATLALADDLVRIVRQGKLLLWNDLLRDHAAPPPEVGTLTRFLSSDGALVAVAHWAAREERVRTLRVFGGDPKRNNSTADADVDLRKV